MTLLPVKKRPFYITLLAKYVERSSSMRLIPSSARYSGSLKLLAYSKAIYEDSKPTYK